MKVETIPIELKAILGQAKLKLNELNVGDVIILNQKLNEPISIRLSKSKQMLGYPCSIKNKKGIKIKKL